MIDQILHFIVASLFVLIFSYSVPILLAVILSIILGIVREINQRLNLKRQSFDFGLGSRLDTVIWTIGAILSGIYLG